VVVDGWQLLRQRDNEKAVPARPNFKPTPLAIAGRGSVRGRPSPPPTNLEGGPTPSTNPSQRKTLVDASSCDPCLSCCCRLSRAPLSPLVESTTVPRCTPAVPKAGGSSTADGPSLSLSLSCAGMTPRPPRKEPGQRCAAGGDSGRMAGGRAGGPCVKLADAQGQRAQPPHR
jgi:hypothetical protein